MFLYQSKYQNYPAKRVSLLARPLAVFTPKALWSSVRGRGLSPCLASVKTVIISFLHQATRELMGPSCEIIARCENASPGNTWRLSQPHASVRWLCVKSRRAKKCHRFPCERRINDGRETRRRKRRTIRMIWNHHHNSGVHMITNLTRYIIYTGSNVLVSVCCLPYVSIIVISIVYIQFVLFCSVNVYEISFFCDLPGQ